VIPVLAKRFGARNLAIVAALVTALVILSYRVFDSFSAWFVIRLLQGMSISTLFVLSEAWIVGSTGDHNRGKIVAIYASVLSGSFGAGPLLISFIGIDGWTPFVLGAGVVLLGIIPFIFIREEVQPEPEETQASVFLTLLEKHRCCCSRSAVLLSSMLPRCRYSRFMVCATGSMSPPRPISCRR
jgi:MFS family permease